MEKLKVLAFTALGVLVTGGCDVNAEPELSTSEINGLKSYVLGSDAGDIDPSNCSGLEHYSEAVVGCEFDDTIVHTTASILLYFVNDKLAKIDANPGPLGLASDTRTKLEALTRKYGPPSMSDYGVHVWRSGENTLIMRAKPPYSGRIIVTNAVLKKELEQEMLESPIDDI